MKAFLQKNGAIVLAFALPIAFVLFIVISTYLPSHFVSTDYDFLYTSCTDSGNRYPYNCSSYLDRRYSVEEGKLVVLPVDMAADYDGNGIADYGDGAYEDHIFLHDTETNESREITLAEAQTLDLSGLLTSPDGVSVEGLREQSGGSFFFIFDGYSSGYGYYLTKGKSRSKVNLLNDGQGYYYNNNFQFIGWTLPGRN